ncbi:MAG: thiamine pyrophosphate-binding protein, partial [Polyangiaceae bacterium]
SAHHLDVLSMVKPVVKLALEITRPEAAPAIVRRAIRTAMSGKRGPVVLTVPMDVARCVVPQQRFFSEVALDYAIDGGMMGRALDEAAASLEAAVRPAILAGSGVRHGLGPERLLHLAERLQIPVMTTPKAKGLFPESHPLSLGVFGHGGHPSSQEHLERGIDVLLAVGTSMGDTGTDGQSHLLRPSETLIHVDVDALQLGRHYPVTLGIVGEADTVLRALARRVSPVDERRHFGVQRHSDAKLDAIGPDGTITPQRALWELQQVLPPDTLYTCDIGEHLLFATHYLQIDSPGGFMAMNGLASMGSGLGAAIGVQLGCPGRTVAAICGDGTFAMHGAEVATASAEGLPIVFVVLDDGRFGMVENGHEALYGRSPGLSTEPVNVRALAEALGARTTVIRKPGEILNANLQSTRRPTVLDVQIGASVRMPKNGRFEELQRAAQE